MSTLVVKGNASGSGTITVEGPNTNSNFTVSIPAATTTLVGSDTTDTLTNKSIAATQLTGTIAAARLPVGSVVQVVSTEKTDTFSTTSNSYTDVTGLSVSITPTSSSSKILVLTQINGTQPISGSSGTGRGYLKLLRGSTAIDAGAAAGSRTPALGGFSAAHETISSSTVTGIYLDSPATTASTTYKIQLAMSAGSGTAYINRTSLDEDGSAQIRMASTITVLEITA